MSESEGRKREEEAEGGPAAAEVSPEVRAEGVAASPEGSGDEDAKGEDPSMEDVDPALLDEVDLREIMRNAMARPPRGEPPDLLHGVQRRLRTRSRGKFYGDGWSTARAPRSTYLVTSLLMLVLIAFVFLVLIPWGGNALPRP